MSRISKVKINHTNQVHTILIRSGTKIYLIDIKYAITLQWNLVIGSMMPCWEIFAISNRTINILWRRKFNSSSFLILAHEALSVALFYQMYLFMRLRPYMELFLRTLDN